MLKNWSKSNKLPEDSEGSYKLDTEKRVRKRERKKDTSDTLLHICR